MAAAFVLVHSPLVGPSTWAPVAAELRDRGYEVRVPLLTDRADGARPTWQQHAAAVAAALASLPADRPLILAGHSGAGALLPAIRQHSGRPVALYLFVDAGIHEDGASRLDLMRREAPAWAMEFAQALAAGGRFPAWSEADLAAVIPDAGRRQALLAELQPRGLAFFSEPIPVFTGWPDAPGAYLHFSPPYAVPAAQARALGWPVRHLPAGHFHMLVDPAGVAAALLELVVQVEANSSAS